MKPSNKHFVLTGHIRVNKADAMSLKEVTERALQEFPVDSEVYVPKGSERFERRYGENWRSYRR